MQDLSVTAAKDFGAAIRKRRKAQGLTQRELALAVGTGERFIVDLEKGKETVRLGKALEVAAALGISVDFAHER
jgi:HTH-type transcriptional regulator / antitoxin HipB